MKSPCVVDGKCRCWNPVVLLLVSLLGNLASVVHSGPAQPVRLVGGANRCEGRLEVLYHGVWGTVCDDEWDTLDATVVCQQLQCGVANCISHWFGPGLGPILLDEVKCRGDEAGVSECKNLGWTIHNCSHYEDVSVTCREHGDMTCHAGTTAWPGEPETTTEGSWSPTSDSRTTASPEEPKTTTEGSWSSTSHDSRTTAWPGEPETTTEGSWSSTSDSRTTASPEEPKTTTEGSWSSTSHDSRTTASSEEPETTTEGSWSSTSDSRTTGLPEEPETTTEGSWSSTSDSRTTASPEEPKTTTEGSWSSTSHDSRTTGSPEEPETTTEGSWSSTSHESRTTASSEEPETTTEGSWSSTSDSRTTGSPEEPETTTEGSWSSTSDSRTTASSEEPETTTEGSWSSTSDSRTTGLPEEPETTTEGSWSSTSDSRTTASPEEPETTTEGSWSPTSDSQEPGGTTTVIYSTEQMPRTTASPGEPNTTLGTTAWTEEQLKPPKDGDVYLAYGSNCCQGKVMVYYQGVWGKVCDDDWDDKDGQVVCRQINCGDVDKVLSASSFGNYDRSRILLDNVKCAGYESNLAECTGSGRRSMAWGQHNCNIYSENAGVICKGTIECQCEDDGDLNHCCKHCLYANQD